MQPNLLALDPADRLLGHRPGHHQPAADVTGLSQQSAFGNVGDGRPVRPGHRPGPPEPHRHGPDRRQRQLPHPGPARRLRPTGLKTIDVQATDQSGTTGNIAELTFFLGTGYVPALDLASDTGRPRPPRDADQITNLPLPTFRGTLDPGATVRIFVNGVLAGTGMADATGAYTVTLTSPLAEGLNTITLQETDAAGNVGPISPPLTVTLDTVPPAPIRPLLLADDDSGASSSDGVTNINTPRFVRRSIR